MSLRLRLFLWLMVPVLPLWAVPSAPNVDASDGLYADKVHVNLSGGTIVKDAVYKIYRNTKNSCRSSEEGCLVVHSGKSYDDTNVVTDITYYYWAQECSDLLGGCSALSAYNTGYAHLPIPKSTDVAASDGEYTDKIALRITPSENATSYKIYRSVKNSLPPTSYAMTTSTSFDDTSVAAGTTYYYWVKACNSSGCSGASQANSGYALAAPAATSVSASDGTYSDKVVLSIASSTGATSYKIYRSQTGTFPANSMASTAATNFNDTGVVAGTTYYYWVKACNSAGCSASSAYNTGYAHLPIPKSTDVTASDGKYTDKIALRITPSENATSYKIYRSVENSLPSASYAATASTSFEDTSVAVGTTYYYWVKACNSSGCSDAGSSNSGYAKKVQTLPKATSIEASDGDYIDKIHIDIAVSDNTTNYLIFRSTTNQLPKTYFVTIASTRYDDISVKPDIVYYYWVKACNAAGCSAASASNSGFVKQTSTVLHIPSKTSMHASSQPNKIILDIDAVEDADKYQIFRSTVTVLPSTPYATVSATHFNDLNASHRTVYYYWVKACNDKGCGPVSERISSSLVELTLPFSWPGEINAQTYRGLRDRMYPSRPHTSKDQGRLIYRVAGLGDSYGAGQGNPNIDGDYEEPWLPGTVYTYNIGLGEHSKAQWDDVQCTRSNRSGFHYGIQELRRVSLFNNIHLENLVDFRFKNYACGGSVIANIINTPRTNLGSKGFELLEPGDPSIEPQLQSMRNDFQNSGNRYDAVLISAGGNDVGFAPAIVACSLGNCSFDAQRDSIKTAKQLFEGDVASIFKSIPELIEFLNISAIDKCKSGLSIAGVDNIFTHISSSDAANRFIEIWLNYLIDPVLYAATNGIGLDVINEGICAVGIGALYVKYGLELEAELSNMQRLADHFALLNQKLMENHLLKDDPSINIVKYPNLFHKRNGEYCELEGLFGDDPLLSGIHADELRYIDQQLLQPLNENIDRTQDQLGWNVIDLPDALRHGICEPDRYVNWNIDALKHQGETLAPMLPFSGGMVHPNDSGYRYEGRQIKDTMFHDIARTLNLTTVAPSDIEISLERGAQGNQMHILWTDNALYETGYKVEIYKVSDPSDARSIHPEDPVFTQNLNRNSTSVAFLEDILNDEIEAEGIFDLYIGPCEVEETQECRATNKGFKRVKYGPIPGEDNSLSFENYTVTYCDAPKIDGAIRLKISNQTFRSEYALIAWSEIPEDDLDGNTTFDDYIGIDHHLPINYEVEDVVKKSVLFKPYATLPRNYAAKKFAVATKLCNLGMCTQWSRPLLVAYPAYHEGDPLVCENPIASDTNEMFHPWVTVTDQVESQISLPSFDGSQKDNYVHFLP